MHYADRLDPFERMPFFGKLPWIALMVLGFIAFWPIGLAVLFFLIWSGRMTCWRHDHDGHWGDRAERKFARHMDKLERKMSRWRERWGERDAAPSSGNRAFDEYRAETLRRLEEEQKEFFDFLGRLRQAKDKAEFDQRSEEHTSELQSH